MDEIQKKLKRLERIEKAIKEFKIGYGCAVADNKEMVESEVEQFFEHLLDIYLEG